MKANKLLMACKKNLPTLLTIASVLSGAAALYFTGKGTIKAVRKYDALKESGADITPKVIFQQVVPYYIPAIGFAVTSFGCNIAGNTIHVKRNRALSLAAVSAIESLRDFKQKTLEVAGEEAVKQIEEKRGKETNLVEHPIELLGKKIRVYDDFTRMKFETTWERLKDAEDNLNRTLNNPCWGVTRMELKEFYRELGVDLSREKKVSAFNYIWDEYYISVNYEMSHVDFYDKDAFVDEDGIETVLLRYFPTPEEEHELAEWESHMF